MQKEGSVREEKNFEPAGPVQEPMGTVFPPEAGFPESPIRRSEAADICDAQLRFLKGRILTVVEAAIGPYDQKRAVKDLVRQEFNLQLKYMRSVLTGETLVCTGSDDLWRREGEVLDPKPVANDG
jgi:hypothetical protein